MCDNLKFAKLCRQHIYAKHIMQQCTSMMFATAFLRFCLHKRKYFIISLNLLIILTQWLLYTYTFHETKMKCLNVTECSLLFYVNDTDNISYFTSLKYDNVKRHFCVNEHE